MNGKICNINASEKNLYGKKETIMEYRDIEKSLNYLDIFADSDELLSVKCRNGNFVKRFNLNSKLEDQCCRSSESI